MEKRQATEFLEYLLRDRNIEGTIYEDALNIAIESLKAQLSKESTTKDAISRQAAINECNKRGAEHIGYAIAHLPTIQPEPRTGKWALGFDNRYMEKYYYCSRCGGRKYGEHEPLDYFCSNCGADMRGEQE